ASRMVGFETPNSLSSFSPPSRVAPSTNSPLKILSRRRLATTSLIFSALTLPDLLRLAFVSALAIKGAIDIETFIGKVNYIENGAILAQVSLRTEDSHPIVRSGA